MFTPQPILPPWKGVLDNLPSILAPSNSFKSCTGFFIDKQRLRSVPKRTTAALWPLMSGPQIGGRSFVDGLGNTHTVIITAAFAYYYVNGVYTAIASTTGSLVPAKTEVYQNQLFYVNGTTAPTVIDGSSVATAISLPNTGTCFFLGKLAARMLYLNLIEPYGAPGASNYPRRFRWSKINDANNFTDPTAGVADIPEIEDNISGYATQGALGYIYRTNGITTVTPTGGISPTFFLENYSAGVGTGNFFPYSLAQWGNLTCFASQEDIQAFNPLLGPPTPIGGAAARSIYTDLSNASGYVIGAMLPSLGWERQGLQYWLGIPFSDNTSKIWMYQFESQSWTNQVVPFSVTTIGLLAVD